MNLEQTLAMSKEDCASAFYSNMWWTDLMMLVDLIAAFTSPLKFAASMFYLRLLEEGARYYQCAIGTGSFNQSGFEDYKKKLDYIKFSYDDAQFW